MLFPAAAEPAPLPGSRKSAVSLVSEPGLCALSPLQPSGQPSLLLQYQESGLSSSSHELSQYIRDGADDYGPGMGSWNVGQTGQVEWGALTREKQGNKWLVVGHWLSAGSSPGGGCPGTRHDWGAAGWVNGPGALPGWCRSCCAHLLLWGTVLAQRGQ